MSQLLAFEYLHCAAAPAGEKHVVGIHFARPEQKLVEIPGRILCLACARREELAIGETLTGAGLKVGAFLLVCACGVDPLYQVPPPAHALCIVVPRLPREFGVVGRVRCAEWLKANEKAGL